MSGKLENAIGVVMAWSADLPQDQRAKLIEAAQGIRSALSDGQSHIGAKHMLAAIHELDLPKEERDKLSSQFIEAIKFAVDLRAEFREALIHAQMREALIQAQIREMGR